MTMDPNAAVFALSLGGVPVIDKSDLIEFGKCLQKNNRLAIIKMVKGGKLVALQVENPGSTFVFGIDDKSINRVQYVTWQQGFSNPQPNILKDMFPELDNTLEIAKPPKTNIFL